MFDGMKKIEQYSDYHTSGIYCIRNTFNGKVYVGSAVDVCDRIYTHRRDLNARKHHSIHLQRAWSLYGDNQFEFFLIELVEDVEDLIDREQHWMDSLQCCDKHKGYNMSPTAGSCLGVKLSDRHKEKIRQAHLGKNLSEEHKRKVSESHKANPYWKGKTHSNATKKKIVEAKTGLTQSKETCAKKNNSIRKGGSRSGAYKGVSFDKRKSKWYAHMRTGGKMHFLGLFDDPVLAAENYDYHVQSMFPDAFLNFPDKDYVGFVPKRLRLK